MMRRTPMSAGYKRGSGDSIVRRPTMKMPTMTKRAAPKMKTMTPLRKATPSRRFSA